MRTFSSFIVQGLQGAMLPDEILTHKKVATNAGTIVVMGCGGSAVGVYYWNNKAEADRHARRKRIILEIRASRTPQRLRPAKEEVSPRRGSGQAQERENC
jgi:shikimate 5-dehydrogenase